MDISNWTVEDFVLHQGFVDSVLIPEPGSTRYWKSLIEQHPAKIQEASQAREILLRMYASTERLSSQDKEALWGRVQKDILKANSSIKEIPRSITKKKSNDIVIPQIYRVAAIICVAVGLSWIVNLANPKEEVLVAPEPVAYVEHQLPAGVKSSWTLADGSKVVLNAGSRLWYIKDFEADRRVLHLEGEAYFEVQKDSLRPFVVLTGDISTTAIGTSFNINAYKSDSVNVYLLTGKVIVADSVHQENQMFLEKGEAASRVSSGLMAKRTFDEEEVMAWTKGVIIFDKTPISAAIKTLENWYGVTFELLNQPPDGLTVSGKFYNEQLTNILDGLSYSARFRFDVESKKVTISFSNP